MELAPELVAAIESAHVAFEGLAHPLKVVGVEPDKLPPITTTRVKITVETAHNGTTKRASSVIVFDSLADVADVVKSLGHAMHGVLAGDRPLNG